MGTTIVLQKLSEIFQNFGNRKDKNVGNRNSDSTCCVVVSR